jgi:uroporphyrinogen-III synthase
MKPLTGVRIAVTRPAHQSAELAGPLAAAGADVRLCPLVRVESTLDAEQWRRVCTQLPEFSWLVFTSTNGVEQFVARLGEAGLSASVLDRCRVACVGPATAKAAESNGFVVDLIPDQFVGSAVADALAATGPLDGTRILLARAGGGGDELPARLQARGAQVEDLELYRSVVDREGATQLASLMSREAVDLLTFTSGSAVTYFVEYIGKLASTAVAVIGPSTAQTARGLGLRVDIEADPHTIAGMIRAIIDYYAADRGKSED